jgi:anaerobic magnesium-protoporphyrin IX monomethyl ester cyclase
MKKKKKLLLVKPPEQSRFNFGTFSLAVLAASVRKYADVKILDATQLPVDDAVRKTIFCKPDMIGVTAMGYKSVVPVASYIRSLKQNIPSIPVVTGGHGASCIPEYLLDASADAVVIGEGEVTFPDIVRNGIIPGSPGIACKSGGEIITGPNQALITPLDSLAFPVRDLMPDPTDKVYLMETSRGCPHACAFCETTRFYGRRWRAFSAERVAEEINILVDDYDAMIIQIADDNFTANPGRVMDICARIKNQSLPLFFMLASRADDLMRDPDLLPAMAEVGMMRIHVGVETLDQGVADSIDKSISFDVYRELFNRMRELGMFSVASFIVGLPGESESVRERSLELAVDAAPDSAHFVPFQPFPGIPLSEGFEDNNPAERDIADAHAFTCGFFSNPTVIKRLEDAAGKSDIKAVLAKATLEKYRYLGSQIS